jgi:hypothetical protein
MSFEGFTEEQKLELSNLYSKRNLAFSFKRLVDVECKGDSRRPAAIARLNDQIAILDEKIAEITGSPPDIQIGLKPGILFATSKLG